jgi:hypothetical protein
MIDYSKLWCDFKNTIINELDLKIKSEQSYQIKENKINSTLYDGDYFIKSRETVITTENSSIYNNIIYPKTGKNLPAFGVDLMAFMEKIVILVFDFQHPIENYDFDHEIVKNSMGEYKNNTKEIRFFEPGNHFSNYIFVRKCTVHEINSHLNDFKKYISTYKKLVEAEKPTETDESVYVDFDTYMHKLDPVSGFMESRFGKEFAKKYVSDFLFSYAKL